jgi:carbon monoxide dehydrogenase subunit G
MRFEGQQTLHVPIQTAWAVLMDPEQVAACTPGFQKMEALSPEHYKATVGVGVGAVKATFTLDVTLTDLHPPEHACVNARGAAAGSAVEVHSTMDLAAESESVTGMSWQAEVKVMGTIASVGARLLEGTAHKLTDRFFDCLHQTLEGRGPGAPTAPAAPPSSTSTTPPA